MTYNKQTWINRQGGGTPLSAARLNHIEDGIAAAEAAASSAIPLSQKGVANGVATLGADGRVPPSQASQPGVSLISEVVVTIPTPVIDFSNIPQTYRSLRLVINGRCDYASGAAASNITFNNDSSASYDNQRMQASASSVNAYEYLGYAYALLYIPPGASAPAGAAAPAVIDIQDYARTTFNKVARSSSSYKVGNLTGNNVVMDCVCNWNKAAAINQITLTSAGTSNWVTGTTAVLYGIV